MRGRPYLWLIFAPVLAYLGVLLVVALLVHPTTLGWIGFGVAAAVALLIGGLAAVLYPRTRVNAVRTHPRPDDAFRLLVIADTEYAGPAFDRSVARAVTGRAAEVLVVAPVLTSTLHFVTDAEESEREAARARLTEALQRLASVGVVARGILGDDDPLQAIGDALAGFPASEILLVAPERGQRGWLDQDLEARARDTFGIHVSTATIATDGGRKVSPAVVPIRREGMPGGHRRPQ